MAKEPEIQQFILLPPQGLNALAATSSPSIGRFFLDLPQPQTHRRAFYEIEETPDTPKVELQVVDSIHEYGPKLVEMSPQSASNLRAHEPGLRILPVVYYYPTVSPRPVPVTGPQTAGARMSVKTTLKVVSQKDGSPIARATVIAFTNFTRKKGVEGVTNNNGEVSFSLGEPNVTLERLYVYPERDYWEALKKNVTVTSGMEFGLAPVDLTYTDALRYFYGSSPDGAGDNVKVGVVDTGIATHPDLLIDGGENTVAGEGPNDFGDNGNGHGTHVAGIIAARGQPPKGIRGLAPAVILRSYRVFGRNIKKASNFAIAKAVYRATADGCDLINMSLGGGPTDEVVTLAIADARARGSVVIAAAGNDDRQPVSFPASDSLAIAVSAMGRKGTFPKGSAQEGGVVAPYGTDKKNFIGSFSNVGVEIDLTGPGVGIISTYPRGYAALDGTSMACPAVTGAAAKMLSPRADILSMSREQTRSDVMAQAILQAAKPLGFGAIYEGQGILG